MEKRVLLEMGLTSNEAEIFIVIGRKGTMSPTEISKELGLNRPYIYYALERLLEKGYVSEIMEGGKKKYNLVSPRQLILAEEHKVEELREFIEKLDKIKENETEDTQVEVLKGRFVIRNILKRCIQDLKPNQETYSIGFDEHLMESTEPVFVRKVFRHMEGNNISEKAVIRDGTKMLKFAKTTEYRFLPSELIGNTAKYIYQDVVMEIIYGQPIYAVIVKNKIVADTARKQFNLFWANAKPRRSY